MKKTKIWFWIVTGLIAAFMVFSAIPEIAKTKEGVEIITGLGYPEYFVPFLGVAKLLGVIAILIPSKHWIKEWAYAGLLFDLAGATYSIYIMGGLSLGLLFMVLPITLLLLSHYLWRKVLLT
jgi:hypothetical protein